MFAAYRDGVTHNDARENDGKFGEQARIESGTALDAGPPSFDVLEEFDQTVAANRARPWGVSPSEESLDAAVLSIRNLADNAGPSPLAEHLRHSIRTYDKIGEHHPVAFKTLLTRALRVRKEISRSRRSN